MDKTESQEQAVLEEAVAALQELEYYRLLTLGLALVVAVAEKEAKEDILLLVEEEEEALLLCISPIMVLEEY
jgi:hypothetical protein